jgi:hypothetical protein
MPCSTRFPCAEWARRGLVRRGDGGKDQDLVSPLGRPRSDDRTGGLRAQALIAGVGQQGDARGEGQQVEPVGLADLGQVMNSARPGLAAGQQPPGRVGDHQRLDGVRAGLIRDEPLAPLPTRRRAAHPHLDGIQQADLPAGAQVSDHIGQVAQPDPAFDGAAALGQQRATSPIVRVLVERDTPNQQANTSWVTP